jgi:hypothetical protein
MYEWKALVHMEHNFDHTYTACMEQHCLWLFVDFAAQLVFLIEDGDVANAYAQADAEVPNMYLSVDYVYQARYSECHGRHLPLGSCVPLLKAIRGHPKAGNWWSKHFNARCTAPLAVKPALPEPMIYCHGDAVCTGSPLRFIRLTKSCVAL